MVCCTLRGLTVADIDNLTVGVLINYIHAYDNLKFGSNSLSGVQNKGKKNVIIANQTHFNSF